MQDKNKELLEDLKLVLIAIAAIPTMPILYLNTYINLTSDERKEYRKENKAFLEEIKLYIRESKEEKKVKKKY